MRGISEAHKNALLASSVAVPLYLALCRQLPGPTNTGSNLVEANYTGYARVLIPATTGWTAPAGGATKNVNAVAFPAASAGTSTVVGWALVTAATAGELRWFGPMTERLISVGDPTPPTVAAGALVLSLVDLT